MGSIINIFSVQLRKEIMIQHSLSHECIVSLNKVFEDSNNVYLLMEMCHYDVYYGKLR